MFQTQGYPTQPPSYYPPDFQTPPHTPASARHQFYSPRTYTFTSPPTTETKHARRATQDYGHSYATPKKPAFYSAAEYSSPGYFASATTTPLQPSSQRKADYVSDRHYYAPSGGAGPWPRRSSGAQQYNIHPSMRQAYRPYDEPDLEHDFEYLPRYTRYPPRPPPPYGHGYEHHTDYARQVPIYGHAETAQPRQRRASYTSKPTYTSSRPRPSTAPKPFRRATEEDARKHQIPAGYSYKNWDPSEEPILLLGSVFDANSLGKWIYDWTVFFHGAATPMSDLAGDLWLLLIQLAGKVKSAEDALPMVRQQRHRDMIEDFLDSGERLWQRFNKLLKICENYMWKAAKRECGDAKRVTMGKTSGCEFVDSIFGRDRELERTEKLMTGIRLWALRYTANVDPILLNPSV